VEEDPYNSFLTMEKIVKKDKRGQTGLITGLVGGVAGLVIATIIAFVIISTILDAGIIDTSTQLGADMDGHAGNLSGNFTRGIGNVALQLPTILLIAAVVLLLGVLVFLVVQWKRMNLGGGGSL